MLNRISYTILLVALLACDDHADVTVLYGKWRVYEYGYSPGNDYITKKVPLNPPQIMEFGGDQTFSSNYRGFEEFTEFTVETDSVNGTMILTLFTPSQEEFEESAYDVELNGNEARLNYRFCIEGCHIGLRKLGD